MGDSDKLDKILTTLGALKTDVEWLKEARKTPPVVSINDVTISGRWYVISILAIIVYFGSLASTYYSFKSEVEKGIESVRCDVKDLGKRLDNHLKQHGFAID